MINWSSLLGIGRFVRVFSNRLFKGLLLVTWIYVLVSGALIEASGSAAKNVMSMFDYGLFEFEFAFRRQRIDPSTPSKQLTQFLSKYRENAPPIDAILDELIFEATWTDVQLISPTKTPAEPDDDQESDDEKRAWERDQFDRLFQKVDNKLRAIVLDEASDPRTVKLSTELLPKAFRNKAYKSTTIALPMEAIVWAINEEKRIKEKTSRSSLIDTFLLLIVLGAFGSLIFLTRDYIAKEQETSIAAYIFRPVLGMFLAMAMFVVDIVAHSLISTADMLEIRHETLFILALAAGLLSEQAYAVIYLRAQKALDKLREKPLIKKNIQVEENDNN